MYQYQAVGSKDGYKEKKERGKTSFPASHAFKGPGQAPGSQYFERRDPWWAWVPKPNNSWNGGKAQSPLDGRLTRMGAPSRNFHVTVCPLYNKCFLLLQTHNHLEHSACQA
jgi:hypothetical protein